MLTKLLKYEFKACARMLLPMYGALIILSLINGLNMRLDTGYNFIFGLSITLTSALCFAIAICSFLLIIQRFWRNLLKDEGYLMFTLPVKTSHLIWSKLISGIFWVCVSGLVGVSALLIWFAPLNWNVIKDAFAHLPELILYAKQQLAAFNMSLPLSIVQCILMLLLFSVYQILIIYCSMAVGQLPLVSKHRVLASFGAYLLIHFLLQNLTLFVMRIFDNWPALQSLNMHVAMTLMLAFAALLCALFFAITNYLLKNQLNLE